MLKVGNTCKSVVQLLELDAVLAQLASQPVVAVAVELQQKWRPGRRAQIA